MKIIISIILALFIVGCSSAVETEKTIEVVTKESQAEKENITYEEKEESEITDEVADDEKSWEVQYKLNENIFTIEPIKEEINENVVLLTIDDAPDQYGEEMAKILTELDVGAIFFVNGHFLKNESGINQLKTIHELGFEIGNHTMNHPNLSELSPEEQKQEIIELNDLIEGIIGERPRFFRAPFGVNTDVSNRIVLEEGMQKMNWSYGYDFDPKYMEKEALIDIMVNTPLLGKGANLLMHDRVFTKDALEEIVLGIRAKGYEFVHPKQIK